MPVPDGAEEGVCRGCGTAIFWIDVEGFGRIPLNTRRVRAYMPRPGDRWVRSSQPIYVSHFTTCSKASEFSKGRR